MPHVWIIFHIIHMYTPLWWVGKEDSLSNAVTSPRTQFLHLPITVHSQYELWCTMSLNLIPSIWGQLWCWMEVSELCLQLWCPNWLVVNLKEDIVIACVNYVNRYLPVTRFCNIMVKNKMRTLGNMLWAKRWKHRVNNIQQWKCGNSVFVTWLNRYPYEVLVG